MQWVSSRIWTRVAVFIFYDDNNYTKGTSWYSDTKLFDGEAPGMLELCEMRSSFYCHHSQVFSGPEW